MHLTKTINNVNYNEYKLVVGTVNGRINVNTLKI